MIYNFYMGICGLFICLTCAFLICLLSIVFFKNKNHQDALAKTYFFLIFFTFLLCISEGIQYIFLIKNITTSTIHIIFTSIFYLSITNLSLVWTVFTLSYFFKNIIGNKKVVAFVITILSYTLIGLIFNFFTHKFFYYENNEYIGSNYRLLFIAPQYFVYIMIFFVAIYNSHKEKDNAKRKKNYGVFFFSLILIIYCTLQFFFPLVPLDVMGFTIASIIIYVFDMIKNSNKKIVLQKTLLQEATANCFQTLYENNRTEVSINKILAYIAEYHKAEHSYIFEINKNKTIISMTYEWSNINVDKQINKLKKISYSLLDSFINSFEKNDYLILDTNNTDYLIDINILTYLNMNSIKRILAVPLRANGNIVGFLGVSNPLSYQTDISLLRSVSSVVYSEILRRKSSERDYEIINILTTDYTNVFFCDLSDSILFSYTIDEKYDISYGGESDIFTAFSYYIEHRVYEPDRKLFNAVLDFDILKKNLSNKKSFEIIFRKLEDDEITYCQLKIIKFDDINSPPTAIALGFSNKNDEIIGKFVINHLLDTFASVFYIDLEHNRIRAYKQSTTMEVGRFSEVLPYDQVVRAFANDVSESDKEKFIKFSDPKFAQIFLAEENLREVIYEVPNLDRPKRRMIWNVIERKDGLPTTVIACFMGVDKLTSEKMELDAKLNEQKKILESQTILLEDALSQAQIANKTKTTFLTNMSHDIRTPMNAIIGFTELALQNIDDKEKVKNYLLKSNVSSQHLLSLINDILDMNRIESGKLNLNEESCNIYQVVDEIKSIISNLASSKKQDLKITKIDIKDDVIYCDKLRIKQIVINIISNAIKFTPEKGKISISIIQTKSKDDYGIYELKVKDNGVGMSESFIDKVFIPFEREKTSTISKTQGTGLGMAITKSIVDMMDGTISVKSTLGKGSEFTVTLPLRISDEQYKDDNEIYEINEDLFKGKRVLIVEDNEMNREIIQEILEESGFITEAAEDGKYAVDMVFDSKPGYYDLILMDIQMPIMNGYEATKMIRNFTNKDLANIPIVAMTANAFEEDRKEAFACGMNEHVTKPLSVENLFNVLSKIL